MTRKIAILLLALMLIFSGFATAGDVSPDTARNVAENWLYHVVHSFGSWGGTVSPTISGEESLIYNGMVVGYNFTVNPKGHILVSTRDDIPAVKLYSENSTLSVHNENHKEQVAWIAEEIFQLGEAIDSHGYELESADPSQNPDLKVWTRFKKNHLNFKAKFLSGETTSDAVSYGPLLTTTWAQGDPYNQQCPLESSGCQTIVGCGATAVSQIMKFWNYPSTGRGQTSYTWNDGTKDVTLSQNFADSSYDWANMPDSLTSSSSTTQKSAVSKLCVDVGIAIQTNYGCNGSYSGMGWEIINYFKYQHTAAVLVRSNYTSQSAWVQVFKAEIQAGRPSLLSMQTETGGHAVVVDGYRDSPSETVHINMGWGGSYDGWYIPDSFITGHYAFSDIKNAALIGIQPPAPTPIPTLEIPVPDTGQTKCYNNTVEIPCPSPGQPFYGQDANYSINPMSYTKLDGNGNAIPDSATSWVMVKDNVTGLIWETKTNNNGKNYNDPHNVNNTYTWYDSSNPATNGGNAGTSGTGTDTEDFIKALNDAKYGGYSDWRLPTIKELDSIVDYSTLYPQPTINTGYFLNTATDFYWSSTTYAYYTDYAWGVYFYYGLDVNDYYKVNTFYVRAVRGGQSGSLGNLAIGCCGQRSLNDALTAAGGYTDNGNGTVTDTSTGLMWQQAGSSTMTWEQALAYCEGLNLGDNTDWRMPTIKELRSLVDYNYYSPSINTTYFPHTVSSFYWSSTTYATLTGCASGVNFYKGLSGEDLSSNKSDSYYVRAVRGGQAPTPTPTACTATIDGNLLLHIPYISYVNPTSGTLSLWADMVYEFNPTSPTLIPFKLSNYGVINNPSLSCTASTLSSNWIVLIIHIPDVLLPDGNTHLWVDLVYYSTNGNAYFVVTNYGIPVTPR